MKKKRIMICCLLVIICMKTLVTDAASGTVKIQVEGKGVLAEVFRVGTKDTERIISQSSNAQELREVIDELDESMEGKAEISGISDANGIIQISGLEEGVYYIRFSGGEYKRDYVSALIQIPEYYQEIYPKYEEVQDTSRTESIKTGDDHKSDLYALLCMASLGVIALSIRKIKKDSGGNNE